MTAFSENSPFSRSRVQRRAAAAVLGAGAIALIAGCSAGSSTAGSTSAGSGTPAKPVTPQRAISLAADQNQHVTSETSQISTQVTGPTTETITGTTQTQVKPTLVAEASLSITSDGQTQPMDEIVTPQNVYLKSKSLSALTGSTGKAWLGFPISYLGTSGADLESVLQNVQNGDAQNQTQMLTASKDVHKVGTATVGGVSTTEYAGTVTPSAALAAMPASMRQTLSADLKSITGVIRFSIWTDAQHLTRKLVLVETVNGATVTVSSTTTSVNQPVQVTAPPASQVEILSKNALSASG